MEKVDRVNRGMHRCMNKHMMEKGKAQALLDVHTKRQGTKESKVLRCCI